MENDPPIRPGDIVRVVTDYMGRPRRGEIFVAKVIKDIPNEALAYTGGLILDYFGNTRHVARERCFHATENEKAEYFRLLLKGANTT